MKQNRLFAVIAAILVAIMLVPSFAMAEAPATTPEFKLEGTKAFSIKLYGGTAWEVDTTGLTAKKALVDHVDWTVSNETVVSLGKEDASTGIPAVYVNRPTAANEVVTITGTAYQDVNGGDVLIGSDSFTVKADEVPVKTIKLVDKIDPIEIATGTTWDFAEHEYVSAVLSGLETEEHSEYTPTYPAYSWYVTDSTKATITKAGLLTAKEAGEVKVYAKWNYGDVKSAEIPVKIVKAADQGEDGETSTDYIPYTSLTFNQEKYTIEKGEVFAPMRYATTAPADAYGDSISWDYDSEILELWNVRSVSDRFKGIKVSEGTVLKAYSKKTGALLGQCTIVVTEPKEDDKEYYTSLVLSPATMTVYLDQTKTLTLNSALYLTATPEDADDDLFWSVDKDEIATVSVAGTVTFKQAGTVVVTVSSLNNKECKPGTMTITVKESTPDKFTDIAQTKDAFTLYEGDTLALGGYLTTTPATSQSDWLYWTSSDASIVSVNAYGDITAKKASDTPVTITASAYLTRTLKKEFKVTVKEDAEKSFDSISFTADKFSVKKSTAEFDPWPYIVTDPVITKMIKKDTLLWTSSNTAIATVSQEKGEEGIVKFGDFYTEKETVTITVCSKNNPKKAQKSFTLEIVNDDKYFDSLSFIEPKSFDVAYTTGSFDAKSYLICDPVESKVVEYEQLIWTSDDLDTAYVTGKGMVFFKKPGTVKITVRSKFNQKATDVLTLNIKKGENPITEIKTTQESITLTKAAHNQLATQYLADYLVFTPVAYDADDTLTWTSSDPGVVNIVEGKLVLGLPEKTAKLTVRSAKLGKMASINVTVAREPLTSAKFIKDVPTELRKSTGSIDLTNYIVTEPFYYGKLYSNYLVWTSDNPQYATVSDSGVVTYVQPGKTVTITISDKDGKVLDSIKLTTSDVWVTDIAFTAQSLEMKVGEKLALANIDYTVKPADADYTGIEWTTSDPDIVNIDGGNLVAVAAGKATITGKITNAYNQAQGTFTVTVKENGITAIEFAKKEYSKKISANNENLLTLYFSVKPYTFTKNMDSSDLFKYVTVESSNRNVVDIEGGSLSYSASKGMFSVKVRCVAPGAAKITVTSIENEKISGKTKVVAKGIPVKAVKMPKKSMKLFYYYTDEQHAIQQNEYEIRAKVQPSNAWYTTTWETSDAGVAFVQDDLEDERSATIIATGAGTATITMNVDDGNTVRQAKMKIVVATKSVDLKLNKKKATITMIKGKDNTVQLEAIDDKIGDPVNVRWTSSNKKVATVDNNGLVTAKKAGTAVITATTKDGNKTTATCNITVEKKPVKSISAKEKISLLVKETKKLKIKVKPTDAYNTALSFKSSDESIVTVDGKGVLTAVKAGEATITVKTTDGSKKTLKIKVTVTK